MMLKLKNSNPISQVQLNTATWDLHQMLNYYHRFLPCRWLFNMYIQRGINDQLIDHFRITFGLFFKASLGAHPFIWKLVLIHMQMKTNFHMKRWAPELALKKRPKVIRKWPITQCLHHLNLWVKQAVHFSHFLYKYISSRTGTTRKTSTRPRKLSD